MGNYGLEGQGTTESADRPTPFSPLTDGPTRAPVANLRYGYGC